MKKILLLLAFAGTFVCSAFESNAQGGQVYTLTQSGDTVTNTETEYLTMTVSSNWETLTFQYVAVKLSGTVAGTATLQGSLDGTYWIDIDTFTNTNVATQTFATYLTPAKFKYYRLKCTGTGTMAARVYAYMRPSIY